MREEIKKCNPCQFYGFFFRVEDLFSEKVNDIEKKLDKVMYEKNTIDIPYEDLTNQKFIENGK
jgi:hypothetical protein